MIKYLSAYAATALVMVGLDFLWLGLVAKTFYRQGMGHLLADHPKVEVAALFYGIFVLGLMVFAITPHASLKGSVEAATSAALFGFFAYATYDLSNLATLRNWPIGLSLLDIGWGVVVSAVSATVGKLVWDRFAFSP